MQVVMYVWGGGEVTVHGFVAMGLGLVSCLLWHRWKKRVGGGVALQGFAVEGGVLLLALGSVLLERVKGVRCWCHVVMVTVTVVVDVLG